MSFFFISVDLEKFCITSLARHWILCRQWHLSIYLSIYLSINNYTANLDAQYSKGIRHLVNSISRSCDFKYFPAPSLDFQSISLCNFPLVLEHVIQPAVVSLYTVYSVNRATGWRDLHAVQPYTKLNQAWGCSEPDHQRIMRPFLLSIAAVERKPSRKMLRTNPIFKTNQLILIRSPRETIYQF